MTTITITYFNGQVIGWSAGGRGYDFTMELL